VYFQVDFSENATILNQDEIQSAHWTHSQVTLFTAHAWGANISEGLVFVSDCLQHTKVAVYSFMNEIFNHLKLKYPTTQSIAVFSDGAASQFKQRFLFSNLHKWEQEHGIQLQWNFFATSHGKGTVDGIGGTVKRSVWRHVKARRSSAFNAKEYAAIAKQRNPNITIKFVSQDEIAEKQEMLNQHWDGVFHVPRTHTLHAIKPSGPTLISVAETSDGDFHAVKIREESNESVQDEEMDEVNSPDETREETSGPSYSAGQWVLVAYDGSAYPGQVLDVNDDEVQVSAMERVGRIWRWPRKADCIFYKKSDVIRAINTPVLVNRRGQFKFDCF